MADPASPGRFAREGGRNRFTARRATVLRVSGSRPPIIRVTVSGPEFETSPAAVRPTTCGCSSRMPPPANSSRPRPRPAGEDGIVRPDRASIARDFTPLPRAVDEGSGRRARSGLLRAPRSGSGLVVGGSARLGDELVVVGPRGSRRAPQDIDGLILICDETSLPSVSRWVREVPAGTRIDVIASVPGAGEWVAEYLGGARASRARRRARHLGRHAFWAALERLGPSARASSSGRRARRRARAGAPAPAPHPRLPAAQAQVSGYWRRGVAAFDHHAPIDPFDPRRVTAAPR